MGPFAFENDSDGDAALCPPTFNPNLWRQARLNLIHGLFEVTPGVYEDPQLRYLQHHLHRG